MSLCFKNLTVSWWGFLLFFWWFYILFCLWFLFCFFKERLICIKNFIKTSLKKHFYFCLCYHCSLINFAVDLNWAACLPLFCSSTEEKEKKTLDTPGSISLLETKQLLGVKLYLCHNSQVKMHSEEFCSISFFSLLSNAFFPLSSRHAAPMNPQLNQSLRWKVNLCLLNLVTFWLQWFLVIVL